MISTHGVSKANAVKFSSSLLLDMGGSGARLDLTTNDGKSFTIPVEEDIFMGAVNVRFRDIEKPDLKLLLSTLTEKFIKTRLTGDKAKNREFEVGPNGEKMTIQQALEKDPLDKIVVSSTGQIKYNNNRPYITAIDNLPAYVKEVDIMGELANTIIDKFKSHNLSKLVNTEKLKTKGIIINDALASVMGLAKKLEKDTGKPLTAESAPVVLMDVGSGIATGGIDGNILYTAESQNARVWYKSAIERLDMLNKRPITSKVQPESYEEVSAMRGITYQTIDVLKHLSMAKRIAHPVYQAIKAGQTNKKGSANIQPIVQQPLTSKDSFDEAFEKTPVSILKDTAWKEGWVNQESVFELSFEDPTDRLGQIVINRFYDGLAALAANKIMEHKANKAYLQCINYENALNRVNAKRLKAGGVALKSPLAEEVNQRLWQYMDYRARTFCDKNAVEIVTLRNNDGTGYLPFAFRSEIKNPWIIRGISEERLRSLN